MKYLPSIHILISSAACVLSTSCVTSYQMPAGYTGPTAKITSTYKAVSSVKGEAYFIYEINGKLAHHSPMSTPRGGGIGLSLSEKTIDVPCEDLTLTRMALT
ncbi:MAG: hypothetical protein ABIS50_04425 [Luteolibacter sp.]|uniref:hypothetical protein n=1 Tax=Luteolibacter sp. TaxID=1962973 RepID=UPI0032659BBA